MTNPTAPKRRSGLVVALIVGLVLAAILAVSVVRWLGEDDPGTQATTPSATQSTPSGEQIPSGSASSSAPSDSPTSTGAESATPDGTTVRTPDGWSYTVPGGPDWAAGSDELAYADKAGRLLVRATQPSYFKAGACADPRSVARGVVGWADRAAGGTSGEVVRNWAHAVATRDNGTQRKVGKVSTRRLPHPQLKVEHSSALVTMDDARGCLPRWVQVSATSYGDSKETKVLVMVREIHPPEVVTVGVKEKILGSVRHGAR